MAHMAGMILTILMAAVASRRIQVPNSHSTDLQTSLLAEVEATVDEGSAIVRVKQPKELQQDVGPSVNTGQADTEAEGLQLHMSANSNSGYLGVNHHNGKFFMRYKKNCRSSFTTAVEAAVAYATARAEARRARRQADTEAEGLQLHMSVNSNSGYLGVNHDNGQFVMRYKKRHCGRFATAKEAAVAYATARAAGESAEERRWTQANTLLAPLGQQSIRAFPLQEAAMASERRPRHMNEAAKAVEVAAAAVNAAAKMGSSGVKQAKPNVSKPQAFAEEALAMLALAAASALPVS